MRHQPKSVCVYEGISPVTGQAIVVILTNIVTWSENPKTGGDLVQAWILLRDIAPHKAVSTGDNKAVCGDCPLRPTKNGKNMCYVTTHFAPLSIWRSYKSGNIPFVSPKDFVNPYGRGIRQGAYGDPAMAPYEVWAELEKTTKHIGTSYTHQWQEEFFDPRMNEFAMASVETTEQKHRANAKGMRTYRILDDISLLEADEIQCPHETKGVQCTDCGLCSGSRKGAKSIAIVPLKSAITKNRS